MWSLNADASSNIETYVTSVGIHGNGRVAVAVKDSIDENGCVRARFDIWATHPFYKEVLSVALTAKASGAKVAIRTNSCNEGYPTLDGTDGTWFFIKE